MGKKDLESNYHAGAKSASQSRLSGVEVVMEPLIKSEVPAVHGRTAKFDRFKRLKL
jgi:hypothetical protein